MGFDVSMNQAFLKLRNRILSLSEQNRLIFIDVAADAGNAIQGTHFTEIEDPIYKEKGVYYCIVPNVPSIFYRNVSQLLSKVLSEHVFRQDVVIFNEIKEIGK